MKSGKRLVYIYTLTNPDNSKVFYVGATFNIEARLAQHINNATYYSRKNLTTYLRNMTALPIIESVDELFVYNKNESLEVENYWIDQFRQWGFALANCRYNLSKVSEIEKAMK